MTKIIFYYDHYYILKNSFNIFLLYKNLTIVKRNPIWMITGMLPYSAKSGLQENMVTAATPVPYTRK